MPRAYTKKTAAKTKATVKAHRASKPRHADVADILTAMLGNGSDGPDSSDNDEGAGL